MHRPVHSCGGLQVYGIPPKWQQGTCRCRCSKIGVLARKHHLSARLWQTTLKALGNEDTSSAKDSSNDKKAPRPSRLKDSKSRAPQYWRKDPQIVPQRKQQDSSNESPGQLSGPPKRVKKRPINSPILPVARLGKGVQIGRSSAKQPLASSDSDVTELPTTSGKSAPAGSRGSRQKQTNDSQLADSRSERAQKPSSSMSHVQESTREANTDKEKKSRKAGSRKDIGTTQKGSKKGTGSLHSEKLDKLIDQLPPENKAGWMFPDGFSLDGEESEESEEPVEPEEFNEAKKAASGQSILPPELDITRQPDSVVRRVMKELWDECDVANPFTMDLWTDPEKAKDVLSGYLDKRPNREENANKGVKEEVQEAVEEGVKDEGQGDGTGFDLEEMFGKSSLADVFGTLGGEEAEDPEYNKKTDEDDAEDNEPAFAKPLDLTFSEEEARQFVDNMKDVDLNQLLKGRKNLMGEFEDNTSEFPGLEDFGGSEWENPFDGLVWEVTNYLYPKKGKRANRQNYAHIHAPPEVLEKRARKRVKRLAIWLSMEISMLSKETMQKLQNTAKGSQEAKSIVETCMRKFLGFLETHKRRFVLWHSVAALQRIAMIASSAGLEQWVLHEYGSIILTLLALIRPNVPELDARPISEIVWAFGKLGPKMFDVRGDQMDLHTIKDKSPVDVNGLYRSIMERSCDIKYGFKPQDVANFVYGVAILPKKLRNEEVAGILVDVCILYVDRFREKDIVHLLWSMGKLGMKSKVRVIREIVEHAESHVSKCNPQEYSMLVGALASLECSCEELLDKIVEEIDMKKLFKAFKDKELANFCWGLTKMKYYPPPWILASLINAAQAKLDTFSIGSTCIVLNSLAVWNFDSPDFCAASRTKFMSSNAKLKIQDIVNSARSFTILGTLDDEYMMFCLSQLTDIGFSKLKDSELRQFYQCTLHFSLFCPESSVLEAVPEELMDACKDAWISAQSRNRPHPIVKEALLLLGSTGLETIEKQWLSDAVYLSSVAKFDSKVTYAVEIAASKNQFQNMPGELVGGSRWREKVLTALGYFRLQIQPDAWKKLRSDEEKLKYLRTVL